MGWHHGSSSLDENGYLSKVGCVPCKNWRLQGSPRVSCQICFRADPSVGGHGAYPPKRQGAGGAKFGVRKLAAPFPTASCLTPNFGVPSDYQLRSFVHVAMRLLYQQ